MPCPDILLVPLGTPGDVQPFVDIGQALLRRGHRVTLVANDYFRDWAVRSGFEFISNGNLELYGKLLASNSLWQIRKATRVFARRLVLPAMRPTYHAIAQSAQSCPNLFVLAQTMALGARIARDKLPIRLVTLHRQPAILRSVHQSPLTPYLLLGDNVPAVAKRFQYALVDCMLDYYHLRSINAFRDELSLPPIRRFANRWLHSPDCNVGLWPDWFAPLQPDWPANLSLAGFTVEQQRGERDPSPELQRFLESGPPPVVFTAGTAMGDGQTFYHASAEACRLAGLRGILVTRFPAQVPASLPPGVIHVDYAPFGWLLQRAGAMVNHGGIGTVAQCLAAGTPQLMMPGLVFDTLDTARRIERLRAGLTITRSQYRPAAVAKKLRLLLESTEIAASCRALAERIRLAPPATQHLADLVQSFWTPDSPPAPPLVAPAAIAE